MQGRSLTLYIDYKSPYAYLAKEAAYRLQRETGVAIDWLPYILDIPAYLGSAKVDAEGRVLEQDRNPHQWRRVRYSYMDVRREANRLGLTIRGTQKIWNSSLAGFAAFVEGEGRRELKAVQDAAEAKGAFGVPSFLFPDGDLYWGREHLPRIREILQAPSLHPLT